MYAKIHYVHDEPDDMTLRDYHIPKGQRLRVGDVLELSSGLHHAIVEIRLEPPNVVLAVIGSAQTKEEALLIARQEGYLKSDVPPLAEPDQP